VRGGATAAEVSGLLSAVVGDDRLGVGSALRLSVERPHRAELRGRRDTPAPPGTMAVYSVRMAMQTTFRRTVRRRARRRAACVAPAARRAADRAARAAFGADRRGGWRDPARRARVVSVVAAG